MSEYAHTYSFKDHEIYVYFDSYRDYWNCPGWMAHDTSYQGGDYYGEGITKAEAVREYLEHVIEEEDFDYLDRFLEEIQK